MELKIIMGEEETPQKETGQKDFPINSDWKKETLDHLKSAYDAASKGDGQLVMEVCDAIERIQEMLKQDQPEEDDNEAIKGMEESKKKSDFMDKFQKEDGE